MTDTTDTITVFDRESTKNGSPIVKTFTLAYDTITSARLKVQMLADPQFLGVYGWKLKQITVNGIVFYPSDPDNSSNLIQDLNNTNSFFHKVLVPNQENTISISFDAPIGAGVISQSAEINAQLIVTGSKNIAGTLGLPIIPTGSDIFSTISKFISNNIPLAIAVLVLIAVIIVAIAYVIGKVSIPKLPSV